MTLSNSQKINLILGQPVPTKDEDLKVKQFTLREISVMTYDSYVRYVDVVTMDVDDYLKFLMDTPLYMDLYMEKHKLKTLDMIMMFGQETNFKEGFEVALETLLGLERGQIEIESFSGHLLFKPDPSKEDVKLIEQDLFDEIVHIIKVSNYMQTLVEDNESNPNDERTRALLEKMKKNREKVAKIKALENDEKPKGLNDIISAVTVKSPSTNKLNILDYTLFQVYDEFQRLHVIENYEMSVKARMFGDNELEDWAKVQ